MVKKPSAFGVASILAGIVSISINQGPAWIPEVRGMSLPDNSIRFLNSIGCIAEPLGDGRYIIGRHPRAAACAVKFLGCIFDAETEFPETPATLGFNLSGRNLMLSPADLDQPIECPDEK